MSDLNGFLFATQVFSSMLHVSHDYAYLDFSIALNNTLKLTCFHKYYLHFASLSYNISLTACLKSCILPFFKMGGLEQLQGKEEVF